jgi:HAD superfamily hydrolase (TIGR01549 family)
MQAPKSHEEIKMSFKLPFWSPSEAEAVLFDWDGVIVDTCLDFSGVREKYYGRRKAMLLEDSASLRPEEREGLMRDLEDIEMAGAAAAKPVPDALGVIAWFERHGVPWAIVSRNCRKSILKAAETLSVKLPGIVRSRDDGDSVKPDPKALADTCRQIAADPAQTLFIGDYVYDMMGARRAGMRGVLVREAIEPGWDEWLEFSCGSMSGLLKELESPGRIVPWEYKNAAERNGTGFLRKTASMTALVPCELRAGTDRWLLTAASLGIGSFAAPDVAFPARSWRGNPSFDLACMGAPLIEAVKRLLRARFPLATIRLSGTAERCVALPPEPEGIESFLLRAEADDG